MSVAQHSPATVDLAALVEEVASRLGVVGAQAAAVHRGHLTTAEAGVARLDTSAPVTPDTLFQIGSTTKMHTALLVMQLVDEGLVGLDVPVAEQLPGFRLAHVAATQAVTPRQLMSMSSGIDNGPYPDLGLGADALARYVEQLVDMPHVFLPGQGFGYSNASTCVSGRLVEHVTGQSWERALLERLVQPAGLLSTTPDIDEVIVRRHAVGHAVRDGRPVQLPVWSLPKSINAAGGTLCSTASDLARFGQIFLQDGRSAFGTQVLTADSVRQMQSPQVEVPPTLLADFWSLGPYGKRWCGGTLLGHSGTNVSGSSYLLWNVEHQLAVATVVNTPALGYPFAQAVFEEVFGRLAGITEPERPEPVAGVEIPFARLVGTYEMTECRVEVTRSGEDLMIQLSGDLIEARPPSRLAPLSPTRFVPTDPVVDGNRGWALAFLGAEEGPAPWLLNGFFCTRRVG